MEWRDHGKWRVRELLGHLGSYYARYSTAQRHRPWPVGDLLDVIGLTASAQTRIARLSGGQRRRLDVAIGIVGRPSCCSWTSRRWASTRRRGVSSMSWCTG